MNKKKIVSVGIFAVVIAIGAGVAYYCYPSVINNALGINSAGVDTISDGDLLAVDSASSSLAVIDPDAGTDDAAADAGGAGDTAPLKAQTPAPPQSSVVSAKKSAVNTQSSVTPAPAVSGNVSNDAIAATSFSPCAFPTSAPTPPASRTIIFNEIGVDGVTAFVHCGMDGNKKYFGGGS